MNNISEEFMEKTKYKYLEASAQAKGFPQPPLEMEYDLLKPKVNLPSPRNLTFGKMSLIEAISSRESVRKYINTTLTLDELAYLLWCTQGVKAKRPGFATVRTVPSAGARHAFETYLLINRVNGLEPGLYRYLALEHILLEISLRPSVVDETVAGCLGQGFVGTSAVTFIWIADVQRMKWRYGDRGYRYLHLDAGHVCQNLYLSAGSIECGVCAIAAFDDDVINQVIGVDGRKQFVIYIATVGKK
jgi:SagB-type dehydrogenase family enzyme